MGNREFRVIVRGVFADLTAGQRAELKAAAAEHDVFDATFTPEGHLTYDIAARDAFTFRFSATGDEEDEVVLAAVDAEEAAAAWLTERGYGFKNLRSQAEDRTAAPLGKRGRREAARK